jgi:hypothetical protein
MLIGDIDVDKGALRPVCTDEPLYGFDAALPALAIRRDIGGKKIKRRGGNASVLHYSCRCVVALFRGR